MTVATTAAGRQRAALRTPDREQRQQLVAVDDRAGGVDGQAPVGVTVVGQAEVGAVLHDRRLQQLEVGGAGAVVDAGAVTVRRDGDDLRARPPVDLGGQGGRRALRAVDDDLQPRGRRRQGGEQAVDVAPRRPACRW